MAGAKTTLGAVACRVMYYGTVIQWLGSTEPLPGTGREGLWT